MTPQDAVLLSRLLSGDLDPDDDAALRHRIAAEPALAAALRRQEAMIADLEALPPELAAELPPVDALRPAAQERPPTWRWRSAALATGLLVAAALLLTVRPPPPTAMSVAGDETLVDGHLALTLPDHTAIDIDGRAALRHAPPTGTSPSPTTREPTMIRHALTGAAAGSLLTVAVYEGRATISGPDQAPVELHAGEQRTLQVAPPAASPASVAPTTTTRTTGATGSAGTDLDAELARLQAENDQLRLENALVKGSLAAHEGTELPWPDDLPASLRAEGFEAAATAAAEGVEGVELVDVDCSEFPCIGVLHSDNTDPGWEQDASGVAEAIADELGDGYGVVAMGRGEDDGSGAIMLLGFSVVPEGYDPQADGVRLGYRSENLMGTVADELRDGRDAAE